MKCGLKCPKFLAMISVFLRAAGYEDRDEDSCKTRIHTLVCGRWERELRRRSPRSLRKLINSYQESAALSQVVINSSQIVIEDSTEDTEESKGNIENVVPNLPDLFKLDVDRSFACRVIWDLTRTKPNVGDLLSARLMQ